MIERVLEFTNSNRRALNLASGKFVDGPPDNMRDFYSPAGTNFLTAAGADLFLSDTALENIRNGENSDAQPPPQLTALDWRSLNTLSAEDLGERADGDITSVDYSHFVEAGKRQCGLVSDILASAAAANSGEFPILPEETPNSRP